MRDKWLNNQLTLAFPTEDMGEALRADEEVSNRLRRTAQSKARREVISCEKSLLVSRSLNPPNRRIRTRMYGGVTGKAGDRLPMSICRPARPHLMGRKEGNSDQIGLCPELFFASRTSYKPTAKIPASLSHCRIYSSHKLVLSGKIQARFFGVWRQGVGRLR